MTLCEMSRKTSETSIYAQLVQPSETAAGVVRTPSSFFNHMLYQWDKHGPVRLMLEAKGDWAVDDHHIIEDVAIVLGSLFQQLWRTRAETGFARFGQCLAVMDGTLLSVALDCSGRGGFFGELPFTREMVGGVATEMWPHFFASFSRAAAIDLHICPQRVDNNHHLIEAAFKGTAIALRGALAEGAVLPSTKGVL